MNGLGNIRIKQPQSGIHFSGGRLDETERADEDAGEADVAHGEVHDGALGLRSVEGIHGDLYFTKGVFFDSKIRHNKIDYTYSLLILHADFYIIEKPDLKLKHHLIPIPRLTIKEIASIIHQEGDH